MLTRTFFYIFFIFLMSAPGVAHSKSVYVVDRLQITMRTGPSAENKIIGMLPSDTRVQVVAQPEKSEDWLYVQKEDGVNGWILKRFVSDETPKSIRLQRLQKENKKLRESSKKAREKAAMIEQQYKELRNTFTNQEKDLNTVRKEYDQLFSEAGHVIEIKEKFNTSEKNLQNTQKQIQQLEQENEDLRNSTRLRWFLSVSVVLFFAWLIGFATGRLQKRRRSQSLSL